jgi:pyruvate-formate lyase-activating enzyme/SAM-dependent methyltransferase
MKALIKVGYGCNENCTFCHTLEVRHIDGSADEVEAKIRRAKELGHDMVVLSGGEPTLRPELWKWATLIASLDLDLGLVTNGLLLSYPEAVERLLKLRLRYVYMSLHGPREVHRAVVRADTQPQALAALKNLTGKGLDLTINCVVVRQNVEHLEALVDDCLSFTDAVLKFSMVQPKGGGDRHFEQLTPRVTYAGARVCAAVAYGRKKVGEGQGLRFAHDGLPFCAVPGLEAMYDDLKTHRFATMVDIGEPDFFPVDDRAKVQPEACAGCSLRGACPGLYRGYHDAFGALELEPRRGGARSNSFNYVYEASLRALDGTCRILRDGVTPNDRARTLFVQSQGRIVRYRTHTRDFADVELEQIKHLKGQLYADLSRKDAPDDFSADMVQLRRSAGCTPCPERDRCTGLFEPVLEDLFARDDARVRELLHGLHGSVLDVGCGDGPYEDVLGPLSSAGQITYIGLEPDVRRVERLTAKRPWATLRQGTAEALSDQKAFDHVLVLRSWNHFQDPAGASSNLERALKPGGTLIVVDNEAFGLARTAVQAARGESSPAAFEHHRNDSAADAHRVLARPSLELIERVDVEPSRSNQWLLRYRKPHSP